MHFKRWKIHRKIKTAHQGPKCCKSSRTFEIRWAGRLSSTPIISTSQILGIIK
jgi:hypothetical protein